MIIVSHPSGNQNVRALLRALTEEGLLNRFITSLAWDDLSVLNRFLPPTVKTMLGRRVFTGVPLNKVSQSPVGELLRFAILQLPRRLRIGFLREFVSKMSERHDATAAEIVCRTEDAEAVWCFCGSCLNTIRAAKAKRMKVYLELPSAYWRFYSELFAEEAELCPEWAATIEDQEGAALFSRIDEELSMADHLIVPSSFVLKTLDEKYGILKCPVSIINYGVPSALNTSERKREPTNKIRALFVGHLTQQKGIGYLFEAATRARSVASLTVVGRARGWECEALNLALTKHRWVSPVAHGDLLSLMREHDVLIHPSLSEGSALVIGEALSQGLVPIITPHCGADHLVKDGVNGFVVPIRDAAAIAEKLFLLNGAREILDQMAANALLVARLNSWTNYQSRIIDLIKGRI